MKSKKILSITTAFLLLAGAIAGSFSNKETKSLAVTFADAPIDYYASIDDSMTGNILLNKLKSIINTSKVDVDYDWSRYYAADEDPNNNQNVILIYARYSSPKSNSGGGTKNWNREHTFPQSKITSEKAKKDNHIVYASDNKVNGARSSIKMGYVEEGTLVKDMYARDTTCRKTTDRFDPHNEARGIVARSTMYAAAMYGFDPEDNFESIETMLKWHLEYSPSTNDMRRNDVVYENQHNRNPFVDHPEYACRVWGNESAATQKLCNSYAPGIDLSDDSLSLFVEDVTTISATTTDSSDISWTNDNSDVISLDSSSSSSGSSITVTGLSAGTATITASAIIDDETYTSTCEVTVSNKPVKELSSISISGDYKTSFELNEDFTSEGLVVTAKYTEGEDKILSEDDYSLEEPDMSSTGTKSVNISYTEGGITKSASYIITVTDPIIHVSSITLNKDSLELLVNQQMRLEATVLPANADNKEVIWSSSNENVATVSFMGLVSAKSVGEAVITVKTVDGGLEATCTVKVTNPQPAGGGCGGNVITTSVILSSLSFLGVGILLFKRKFIK